MKTQIKIIMAMLFLLGPFTIKGQTEGQEYRTMNGEMTITGQVGDSSMIMKSNMLLITLNYETAELTIRLNKRTLKEDGKLGNRINNIINTSTDLLFQGELGLDYVITRKHPPLDFEVTGYLYGDNSRSLIEGKGQLVHIHADEYACLLNMDFEINPELLGIDWPGEKKVKVQILQTVLKRTNE